jgi:transposase
VPGPSPVDRGRTGSKHHLIVDRSGIPLAATLTGGNRNDVTQLLPLVDGTGPIRGKPGRPRQRADSLIADRGYDHDNYRRELWARGVKPIIARRATEHGSGLGRMRRVVAWTFAWLHQFRRGGDRLKRLQSAGFRGFVDGLGGRCQIRRISVHVMKPSQRCGLAPGADRYGG